MRIGVIFSNNDVARLKGRRLDGVLIAPACTVDEDQISTELSVSVTNLNDFIEKGEMAPLSRICAAYIRGALADIDLPIAAKASQNDIYQYHLRRQFLFTTSLERYLGTLSAEFTLVFPFQDLPRYHAPMRPGLNVLFNNYRTYGYLSKICAATFKGSTEFTPVSCGAVARIRDKVTQIIRSTALKGFVVWKLVRKILKAEKQVRAQASFFKELRADKKPKVGIVVRTDSEVISAASLINKLEEKGIGYLVIQDELLTTETTSARLGQLGLTALAIGGSLGKAGFLKLRAPTKGSKKSNLVKAVEKNLQSISPLIPIAAKPLSQWMVDRLLDFQVPQHHFQMELEHIIESYDLQELITFAYVDQWGAVITKAGDTFGIKTVCVQNAAQTPEEYPRLAWSSHYCVESRYLKDTLQSFGYPVSQISATGLPHFITGFTAQANLPGSSAIQNSILVLTQPIYHSYYVKLIQKLSVLCAQYGYELHIKYHPRQLGTEYNDVIAQCSSTCLIKVYHREDLDEVLAMAGICVSVISASIMRALNRGVPTVSFLPKSEKYLDLYYCSPKNLFVAENYDVLAEILDQAVHQEEDFWQEFKTRRQHYIDNHLTIGPTDDASENICQKIQACLPQTRGIPQQSLLNQQVKEGEGDKIK